MSDPLKELLSANAVPTTNFPPTSRYAETNVTTHDGGEGTPPVPHLKRRFCPASDRFATLYNVRVIDSDRRDTLANQHLGDPALWWRLADANGILDPRALTDPVGSHIRVTLAQDIPGGFDD